MRHELLSIDVFPKSNRFWMNLEYVGCISADLIGISESKTNHKAVFVKFLIAVDFCAGIFRSYCPGSSRS